MTHPAENFQQRLRESVNFYKHAGVGVIRGVFSTTEIREFLEESDRLWAEQQDLVPQNIRVGLRQDLKGGVTLERLDPVADISALFASVNTDDRMRMIAAAALGESPIVLKEKLIYKWPGTVGYGPHRDEPYFGTSGVPGREMVSVAIALDPANQPNGAIKFYPAMRNRVIGAPENEPRDLIADALKFDDLLQPILAPGDVVFFDGMIPHCSDSNSTSGCRRTYTATYGPAHYPDCREKYYSARITEMENERKQQFPGPYFIK